jgi:ribosome-binding protein aMBF1 (putative translation factor)
MANDTTRKCRECGKAMAWRGYQHKEKVGYHTVTDATTCSWQCPCGEIELTIDALAGYQRRAAAVALREVKEVDGAVMKYARKALGLKQTELAAAIDCAGETVSRYETGDLPVPKQVRLAVVALLDGVDLAEGWEQYLKSVRARAFEVPEPRPRRACG